uniref:SEA domain-containing protein n=1 Tax=Branchiostoma floridae TaxID=7739 RepID=C3Y180_BRAFL|eukprot:XP_002609610.1 hypothetical protein BRAFLDRAFT_125026 [Branchiostoma floridae]
MNRSSDRLEFQDKDFGLEESPRDIKFGGVSSKKRLLAGGALILILAVVGLAVGLGVVLSRAPPKERRYNGEVVLSFVRGEPAIFSDDLTDGTSALSVELATYMEREIDALFSAGDLKNIYSDSEVTGFTDDDLGIAAKFVLRLRSPKFTTEITDAFRAGLGGAENNLLGTGGYVILPESLVIQGEGDVTTTKLEITLTAMAGLPAEYTDSLGDGTSADFQKHAVAIEESVDILFQGSDVTAVYEGCKVLSFRSVPAGGVLVELVVYQAVDVAVSAGQLAHTFKAHLGGVMHNILGSEGYFVDPDSILAGRYGTHAPYMRAQYPTKTFTNHYTIVTGLYPESHGIIDNLMYDEVFRATFRISSSEARNARWWGGEPLWNTVEQQGLKAATYFWPGSDVDIQGMLPSYYYQYDGSVPYEDRIDQALQWLELPQSERPSLLITYFDQPDLAGHIEGPDSDAVNKELMRVDKMIGRLMDGLHARNLSDCVNVVVVADHGMTPTSCDRVVYLEDLMDISPIYVPRDGTLMRLTRSFRAPESYVWDPDGVVKNLTCVDDHFMPYTKQAGLPKRLHYANNRRIEDVVCTVEDEWLFARLRSFSNCDGGEHGYDNEFRNMSALFIAYGPAFHQGVEVEPFGNIELYNMFSDLLGVTPAPNNGTRGSLNHLLRQPRPIPPQEDGLDSTMTCSFPDTDSDYNSILAATMPGCSCNVAQWRTYDQNFNLTNSEDVRLPAGQAASCSEYENTTLSMGFLYPPSLSADLTGQMEALVMSNVVPQHRGFKEGLRIFSYHVSVSQFVEDTTTGMPIRIPLPTHFFVTVTRCDGGSLVSTDRCPRWQVVSFILPHADSIPTCMTPREYLSMNVARVKDVELLTGLTFYRDLPVTDAIRLKTHLPEAQDLWAWA